jgi:hypothetical protein
MTEGAAPQEDVTVLSACEAEKNRTGRGRNRSRTVLQGHQCPSGIHRGKKKADRKSTRAESTTDPWLDLDISRRFPQTTENMLILF